MTVVTLALFALMPFTDRLAAVEDPDSWGLQGFLWVCSWLGFVVIGGALAARRPEHPIGWILAAIPFLLALAINAESLALHHATVDPHLLGDVATWLTFAAIAPAFILLPFLVLLFPSGRVASRRWRRLARVAVGVGAVEVIAVALVPSSTPYGVTLTNPLGVPALEAQLAVVVPVLGYLLAMFGVAAVVDAFRRFRRSNGVERLQFRWFARSALLFPIGMGASIFLTSIMTPFVQDLVVSGTFFVSFNGMAVAIGIAISRYRLYDIDRVVSRTVSYVLLTVALAGVYGLGVVGVGAVLPGERSDLLVAGSTLAVAALFQPMRRRIQATVDRRFNRARYDAVQTIEAYGARLREHVDLDSLTTDLRAVADGAVQPATTSLWLAGVRS